MVNRERVRGDFKYVRSSKQSNGKRVARLVSSLPRRLTFLDSTIFAYIFNIGGIFFTQELLHIHRNIICRNIYAEGVAVRI